MYNQLRLAGVFLLLVLMTLAGCGGGGISGTPAPAPPIATITAQPADQNAVAGTAATFSVVASNAGSFQWQRSTDGGTTFANVSAATDASHTTALSTLLDNGTKYRVLVVDAGAGNSVTSSAATLTVTVAVLAPSISVQPAAQSTTAGQNASFSVTAAGTALTYQWQRSTNGGTSFADMAGASNATLTLTSVAQADNTQQFRVAVSNSAGSITSTNALLTVNAVQGNEPAFTTQPVSLSITEGQSHQFVVAVTGTPTPTLNWQTSAGNGAAWSSFGVTTQVYAAQGATVADSGRQYRVVASNSVSSTVSDVAVLTVTAAATAPAFTIQPASVTITAGNNAQFTVAVSGTPTPTLQWQLSTNSGNNWSNITGATNTVFDVTNAAKANIEPQFRAVASNSVSTVNSSAATLTVNAAAKAWQPAVRVGAAIGGSDYTPQIAFDAAGNAIAVWQHLATGMARTDIWANRYIAGTGWGTPTLIENDDTGTTSPPQLGVDAAGNSVVVWDQSNPSGFDKRIVANTFAPATGWGTARTISGNGNNAGTPKVAMSANGTALVAWNEGVASIPRILTAGYTAGSWRAPIEVDAGNAGGYQVAMDASGNGLVAWLKSDGTRVTIWASACPGANCGSGQLIETGNSGDAHDISLAMNATGSAVVVWETRVSTRFDIWSNRYVPGAGWGTATLIEAENSLTYSLPANQQVGIDNSGNATATWTINTGNFIYIYANTQSPGAAWGQAIQIKSGIFNDFQFGMNAIGNILGMWRPGNGLLFANDIYVTTPLSWSNSIAQISTTDASGPPRIALDVNGNAIAVWTQLDGGGNVLWASVYK